MSTPNTLTGPDGHRYAIRLDRDQVARIMHHFHWIPASRGILHDFVTRTHPGWFPNEFATVFRAADLFVRSGVGGPPKAQPWLVAVWISGNLGWYVETSLQSRPSFSSRND